MKPTATEAGNAFAPFAQKMRANGQSAASIKAFQHSYETFLSGDAGWMPENTIAAIATLPNYVEIPTVSAAERSLLAQTVVLKLNGGLGTGMGLSGPKSLLLVREGLTFLDLIAQQILHLRQGAATPRFLLMNSDATSKATRAALQKYPALGSPEQLELMQSFVPKVDLATGLPAEFAADPSLAWCPPGHGDIYPSLVGSGWLERFRASGCKYLFVSNSDNLGASLDLRLLRYFAASRLSFLMEVCERTAMDSKGGHLARRGQRFLLRESAQCPEADKQSFEDITRHRFFNTNNLWIQLDDLAVLLSQHGGFVPLPLIKNVKSVDPRDKQSPKVVQLETAMGAAIGEFERAGAIVVPRSRFAPVKTCADLLAIRSDAFQVTPDHRIELHPQRAGKPPTIRLDANHYARVDQLDAALAGGIPSLLECDALSVEGAVTFSSQISFRGTVAIRNAGTVAKPLSPGTYADQTITL